MNKFLQGEDVQSLVDRGAPVLTVMDYREIPERVGIPCRYMYLCDNNKWYNEFELGKL